MNAATVVHRSSITVMIGLLQGQTLTLKKKHQA